MYGTILKTTNAGTDWTAQTSGTTYQLNSVYFTDANTGYAVGYGTILKTNNAGTDWSTQTSGTTNYLRSVYFTDANTGYAVGFYGTIIKTTTGGVPASVNSNTYNNSLKIYPNPSDGKFTIEFSNPYKKPVSISITDITGNTVFGTTSTQEKYEFNGKELIGGVYTIRIKTDKEIIVKKLTKK